MKDLEETMYTLRLIYVLLLSCWAGQAQALRPVPPDELRRAAPGDVLRITPLPGGAPDGIRAYRILYRSHGMEGGPILVSGALFYANIENERRPRPILAWAHPTTGVTRDCSPTRRTDVFNKIPGIEALVRAGFAVVATDYAGFASVDPHPYLVGESHARSVLDAVRAVRQFRKFRSSNRFAVWGHSQGGHAALWTGELQPIYAPELELVGVAAAAPATQLADLFRSNLGSIWGNALTAMALHAWSQVYKIPARSVIHPAATPAYRRLARDCLMSLSDVLKILRDERPLEKGPFFLRNPTEVPDWRRIMDINSPGQQPIAAPVLIAQGRRDRIVPHHITTRFVADRCASGSRIHFVDLPRTDHMYAAEHSARYTVAWIKARFAGHRTSRLC